MTRHVNIPIFIPHLGCPNQCVFCNQRTISGVSTFDLSSVDRIISDNLRTIPQGVETEVAFFGGSFTGIDRRLMIELLEIAKPYIDSGRINSLRCSTRPDYIDDEVLTLLDKYGVGTIELGLQSVSDYVLSSSKRGHNFGAECKAARLIVNRGFDLVGQMMIGLPGSDVADEIRTAEFIIASGAKAARIYPTVVFRDTELCDMCKNGTYTPLSLTEAVERSALVLERFINAGVDVIRIGLCSSENLLSDTTYYAGPNHAAIGELVINQYYLNVITQRIADINPNVGAALEIRIPRGSRSKVAGQKNRNKILLTDRFSLSDVTFAEDDGLPEYEFRVTKKG